MKVLKITFFLCLFFLNNCLQTTALLGPGLTVATTGNIVQAGFQYGANNAIKKETGKDAFEHLKDAVDNENKDKKLTLKLRKIIQSVKQKISKD